MLKVGDKVINTLKTSDRIGEVGTIIDVDKTDAIRPYLVEYQNDIRGGHDGQCFTRVDGKDGHCWWEKVDTIKKIERSTDMKLLEKICRELNIELNTSWRGKDGENYQLSDQGNLYKWKKVGYDEDDWDWASEDVRILLRGEVVPEWKPKRTEKYYVPCINSPRAKFYLYDDHICGFDEDYDEIMFERGLVFRTKEEAQECAINMIELAKHGI